MVFSVKIRVDPDKCQGHSRCIGIAPDLSRPTTTGLSTVVGDGTVPVGREDAARSRSPTAPSTRSKRSATESGSSEVRPEWYRASHVEPCQLPTEWIA